MSKIEGISAFCSPLEKSREEENSSWIYSSSSSSSFSFLSFGVRRVLPVPIEKELASNRRANFDRRDTCYNTFLRLRFGNSRFRNEGVTRLSRKRTRE